MTDARCHNLVTFPAQLETKKERKAHQQLKTNGSLKLVMCVCAAQKTKYITTSGRKSVHQLHTRIRHTSEPGRCCEMTHTMRNTRRRRVATFRNTYFEVRNTLGRFFFFFRGAFCAAGVFFWGGESFSSPPRRETRLRSLFSPQAIFFSRLILCLAPQATNYFFKKLFFRFLHRSTVLSLRGMVNCDSNHMWDTRV